MSDRVLYLELGGRDYYYEHNCLQHEYDPRLQLTTTAMQNDFHTVRNQQSYEYTAGRQRTRQTFTGGIADFMAASEHSALGACLKTRPVRAPGLQNPGLFANRVGRVPSPGVGARVFKQALSPQDSYFYGDGNGNIMVLGNTNGVIVPWYQYHPDGNHAVHGRSGGGGEHLPFQRQGLSRQRTLGFWGVALPLNIWNAVNEAPGCAE